MYYPLAKLGTVIGTPYAGTHTLGNWQSDNAIDLGTPIGTDVIAVQDGVIGSRIGALSLSGGRFAGLRLTLECENNAFYYAHLSKLDVRAGQPVQAGQKLGESGWANVAHLHFACERGSPWAEVRAPIAPQIIWTSQKRWLWLRWWLGEGEFKKYGKHNVKHRPKTLPSHVPTFVWHWAQAFLRRRQHLH